MSSNINNKFKISIIVPVYNVEKYLKKCIDSILNQSYKNFELLLVDDGSTDNSSIILDTYEKKDNRIKVFHKKNGGQGSARNVALDYATGDYIGFVDSDDYIKTDMYETLLECMIAYDSDIAICGVINDHLFKKKEFKYYEGVKTFSSSEDILNAYYETAFLGDSSCNKLYKANLWEVIRFPEIKSREDIAILYKIYFSCNRIIRIGDCKYIQFIRPGSTEQKKFTKDKLISIQIAKEQKEYVKNNFPDYYNNISDIVLKKYITCLKEIIGDGYIKNKVLFNDILKEYFVELNKDEFSKKENYNAIFKHKYIFFFKIKINKYKKSIINIVKRIIVVFMEK